jgi:hypothetical protein
LCIFCLSIIFVACSRKGSGDVDYRSIGYTQNFPDQWYVYKDFVNINQGDVEVVSYNENSSINFDVVENGNKAIQMIWDGNLTTLAGGTYAGQKTSTYSFYFTFKETKDLSSSSYIKLKFDVKGFLFDDVNLKVTLFGNDLSSGIFANSQISSNYKTFEVNINTSLVSVLEIAKFELVSKNGKDLSCGGGNIFLDNIRFSRS